MAGDASDGDQITRLQKSTTDYSHRQLRLGRVIEGGKDNYLPRSAVAEHLSLWFMRFCCIRILLCGYRRHGQSQKHAFRQHSRDEKRPSPRHEVRRNSSRLRGRASWYTMYAIPRAA